MIRATTPKHVFTFEEDPSVYQKILITYAQSDKTVLEKTEADLTFEPVVNAFNDTVGYSAWFRMTQDEANLFVPGPGNMVSVQVRVLTTGNEALASDIKRFSVQDVLNDEVL